MSAREWDRRAVLRAAPLVLLPRLKLRDAWARDRPARLGFLGATYASRWATRVEAFRAGLRELGYVEGKDLTIEYRWADEDYDRLSPLLTELLRLPVDVLVTYGTPATLIAKKATQSVPIVMVHSGDALAAGIVASLAHPGGNVTGGTFFVPELMAKRLELLREVLPRLTQVGVPVKPDNPFFAPTLKTMRVTASALKMTLHEFSVLSRSDFDSMFAAMVRKRVEAATVIEDAVFVSNAGLIADLALRHRIAAAGFNEFAEAGGLIGYGVDFLEMYRRAAVYVDKILKGARPRDLPLEQAARFELILNARTAKALRARIPQSMLQRAERLVE